MRILLDQGLSPAAASALREGGWEAMHVIEIAMDRADDLEILEYCRSERRVCVTLDHDFHAHLARMRSVGPSVVFLRSEGLNSAKQAALMAEVLPQVQEDLELGAAVTVDKKSIRIRRLPLR